jgi:membrane-associated phospholipid phosphatase
MTDGSTQVRKSGPLGPPRRPVERGATRQTVLLLLGLLGIVACLVVFGVLAEDVRAQEAIALDARATLFLHSLASPTLDAVMNTATFLGSEFTLVPVLVLSVTFLVVRGHRREAAFVVVAIAGSVLVNGTMKVFFHRARPDVAWADVLPDFSFPSGHTMNSMVLYLSLALVVWRLNGPRWGSAAVVGAVVLAVVIGMSRIYLGYHYLTDVIAGLAAAILWLAIVVAIFRGQALVFARRGHTSASPPSTT